MINDDRSQAVDFDKPIAPVPSADVASEPATFTRPSAKGASARPKHLRAFGFKRNPFPVVPDANGFYLSRTSETIVAEVLHTIESRKGFMVLTGEVGLGKTTLSRRILMELEERGVRTALVFNTFHQGADLLREINRDFGLEVDSDDLQSQMATLNEFLLRNLAAGVNCAIIIDDAQQLSVESLELVRQVSNLETDVEKLVQILLIGQPELDDKLETHELRQLASRIVLRHRVAPFSLEETTQYVQFKIMQAAGHGRLQVTTGAYRSLQELSGGNPRQINILMDRSLYGAIAFGSEKIDRKLLAEAARDVRPEKARKPGAPRKLIAQSAVLLLLLGVLGFLLMNPALVREKYGLWGAKLGALLPADTQQKAQSLAVVEWSNESPVATVEMVTATGSIVAEPEISSEIDTPPVETSAPVAEESIAAEAGPAEERITSVESFLAAYNLQEHTAEFERAVDSGLMDEIGARIRLSTGLRLVSLSVLPEDVTEPVFRLADADATVGEHLLFWRPKIWSPAHFYFHYRDSEVKALQGALQVLGHYAGEIDGLAGPGTSTALRRFQSSMNLKPSGIPDTTTLFLLEHVSGVAAVETAVETAVEPVAEDPGQPGTILTGHLPAI